MDAVKRLDASLAKRLKLAYTTPELVFYRIDIDGTNSVLVIGGDGEGAYEWLVLKGGAVEKHSDCGYGMSDIALRDGLIYCFGLPPADGYFMKQIAPKTEPAVTPSETPCSRPAVIEECAELVDYAASMVGVGGARGELLQYGRGILQDTAASIRRLKELKS